MPREITGVRGWMPEPKEKPDQSQKSELGNLESGKAAAGPKSKAGVRLGQDWNRAGARQEQGQEQALAQPNALRADAAGDGLQSSSADPLSQSSSWANQEAQTGPS